MWPLVSWEKYVIQLQKPILSFGGNFKVTRVKRVNDMSEANLKLIITELDSLSKENTVIYQLKWELSQVDCVKLPILEEESSLPIPTHLFSLILPASPNENLTCHISGL